MLTDTAIEKVRAAELILDYNLYPRHQVNPMHVADLRRAIEAGCELPPIIADRQSRRVVDGFHRVKAVLRISPDAAIAVEWRDYKSEADLLLDAIALNAAHGEKLTPYDKARCISLAEQYGIEKVQLAQALRIRVVELENLTVRKFAYDGVRQIPIKGTLRPFAGKRLSEEQVEGNRRAGGPPALFFINQVRNLIVCNLIDRNDQTVVSALMELHKLIEEFLSVKR